MSTDSRVYLLLFIVGTLFPGYQFWQFLSEYGFDLALALRQINATALARFGWADVIVSAIVTLQLIGRDGGRFRVAKRWLPIVATLTIGVSAGLPLFLYLRQRRIEWASANGSNLR